MPLDYDLIGWNNDNPPAINQDHLNIMDKGIKGGIDGVNSIHPTYTLTWELGKNIDASGSEANNVYMALSNLIPCTSGIVNRLFASRDNNNYVLQLQINEYKDGAWKKRTSIGQFSSLKLDADTNGVRLAFGRLAESGVNISQTDIDTYFKADVLTNSASLTEFQERAYYLPQFEYEWLIGKNVDAVGDVVDGITYGSTSAIAVYGGHVKCFVPKKDYNTRDDTIFRVSEFKNGVFVKRTRLYYGEELDLENDTTEIRFTLVRGASTGIVFTQADIDTYFNVKFYSQALSKGEYIRDKQSGGIVANMLKLAYMSVSGDDSSTEQLQVTIPINEENSEKFLLGHCVNASVNADVWRIIYAYKNTTQITRRGEWECALHLADRDDFSGGIVHGDEVDQQVNAFADGVKIAISALDGVECSEFKLVRNSLMYDPADHTTIIAEHGVEYTFSVDGLKIKQTVKWRVADILTSCYLAMLPIMKEYSRYRYDDMSYNVVENTQSHYSVSIPNAKSVSEFSDTNETFFSMSINEYPTGLPGGDRASITDNGGINYNKIYFVICTSGNSTVGELWKSETVYRFK